MILEVNAEVLNKAFELGMEFGENWLKSIQGRIESFYPDLSEEAVRELDEHISEMREYGFN